MTVMSTHTIVQILDDLDQRDGAETRYFAFDGVGYEIDLVDDNAAKMREALRPFIDVARRAPRGESRVKSVPAATKPRSASLATRLGHDLKAIREWAINAGKEVGAVGRIPDAIVQEYDEAIKAPARPAKKAPAKKAAAKKATSKQATSKEPADASA